MTEFHQIGHIMNNYIKCTKKRQMKKEVDLHFMFMLLKFARVIFFDAKKHNIDVQLFMLKNDDNTHLKVYLTMKHFNNNNHYDDGAVCLFMNLCCKTFIDRSDDRVLTGIDNFFKGLNIENTLLGLYTTNPISRNSLPTRLVNFMIIII